MDASPSHSMCNAWLHADDAPAEGGPGAASEAQRMVVEKVGALASAQWPRRLPLAGSSLETAGRLAAVRSNASCRANLRS